MQGDKSLAERFSRLAQDTPDSRRVDLELRTLDIFLSAFFLLISLPLTIPIGIANLVTSGRPVFYRGERVGRGGRVFTMTKFRTLQPGAESRLGHHLGPALVDATAAEVTKVGRWLRATQLDEIPQFWNVLKGDMSLVGPRPCMERQRALYGHGWDQYCAMRPGITGLWQVSGRNRLSFAKRVELDVHYVNNWSLWLDLQILARTVRVVITGHGSR